MDLSPGFASSSGTDLRALLGQGELPPAGVMRPESATVLSEKYRAARNPGSVPNSPAAARGKLGRGRLSRSHPPPQVVYSPELTHFAARDLPTGFDMVRFCAAAALAAVFLAPVTAAGQTASIGHNFEASNATESGSIPPDTNGAVGPNHVVMQANGRSKMFDKAGLLAAGTSQTLTNFWTSRVGQTTNSSFDPRIVYDRQSGRWFASANDGGDTANSGTLIGVSPGVNPTVNGWFGVRQVMDSSADPRWADYNQLAVGPTWVAVTNNMFDVSTIGAVDLTTLVSLITIPKANLVAGNATNLSYKANLNPSNYGFTPHTVTDHFAASAATQYTLSAYNSGTLQLSTISGTAGNPAYTDFAAGITLNTPYTTPPNAPQQGSASLIDTGDTRFGAQPVLVNGKIWAVHTTGTGSGNPTTVRWYRINAATNAFEAQGNLTAPAGLFLYYPSIAVNQQGDIVIGYSGSSTTSFPSTYYTVGRFDGTNTTFGSPVQTFAGTGAITNGRFGDYSSTNLDPADPGLFWTFQEYGSASTVWRTRATEIVPARAGEVRFSNLAGGAVNAAGNYFAGAAPLPTDHLILSRWQTANSTITAPGNTSVSRLSARQTGTGTTTFSLGGTTLTLSGLSTTSPSLAIAEFQGTANVAVTNGTLSTQTTIIGGEAVGVGTLTIGTAATWTNAANVFLGGTATAAGGTGTLTVNGGGAATVTGQVKLWNNASSVAVGATASPGTLTVGGLTNPAGTAPAVTVTAAGSRLRVLGAGSPDPFTGTVTVNGGTLDGTGTLAGGVRVNVGGTLQGGTGSSLTASQTLTLSGGLTVDGANTFRVSVGDTVGGNSTANPTSSRIALGSATFLRDTAAGSPDLITVVLAVDPARPLDFNVPYTITLITYGTATNFGTIGLQPTNISVGTPEGFLFSGTPNLTLNATSLTLTFTAVPVPEPATVLAFAAALLAGGRALRRRVAA